MWVWIIVALVVASALATAMWSHRRGSAHRRSKGREEEVERLRIEEDLRHGKHGSTVAGGQHLG